MKILSLVLAAARKIRYRKSIIKMSYCFPFPRITPHPSTHIGRITNDSILIISGSTMSFTVDTPEDKGLVSIKTTVNQLLAQIPSLAETLQQFKVTDKKGITGMKWIFIKRGPAYRDTRADEAKTNKLTLLEYNPWRYWWPASFGKTITDC